MGEIKFRFSNNAYNGSRTIDIDDYNYQAVYAMRADLINLINGNSKTNDDFKEFFQKPGIYILKSYSNNSNNEIVYIGKAYNKPLGNRLKDHNRTDKIEFTEAVAFATLNKSFPINTEYVESRLVELAKNYNNSQVENDQQPQIPPVITSSEVNRMEKFIEYVKIILPLIGYKCLMSNVVKNVAKGSQFEYKLKNYDATMVQSNNPLGFIVLKGSKAKKDTQPTLIKTYTLLKNKYINNGILTDKGNYYEFKENTIFDSPTAAASVVLGSQTSGPAYWINVINNKTWKQNQ
jgi:hypothetical protein